MSFPVMPLASPCSEFDFLAYQMQMILPTPRVEVRVSNNTLWGLRDSSKS